MTIAEPTAADHDAQPLTETPEHPLSAWSFQVEDEPVLARYVGQLTAFARECVESPGEESALNACATTRHVWNAAEAITHTSVPIETNLLQRAIQGIDLCIQAVSNMNLPKAPPEVTDHVRKMIQAMNGRRDDLLVLLEQGKMAFFRRLQANLPAAP